MGPSDAAKEKNGPTSFAASVPLAERIPLPPTPPAQITTQPEDLQYVLPHRPWHFCFADMPTGCYRLTLSPNTGWSYYVGTLRVDHDSATAAISGDLYRYWRLRIPRPEPPVSWPRPPLPHARQDRSGLLAQLAQLRLAPHFPFWLFDDIPVFPRRNYYSYLRVTGIQGGPYVTTGSCHITMTAEEHVYNQPAAGSFDGSFSTSPTRTLQLDLTATAPGSYTGQLMQGGVAVGSVELSWITERFRGATLEIHTLQGAVAPQNVTAHSGIGSESFDSVFDTSGWDVEVVYDTNPVPVPQGVNANACWADSELFGLLNSVLTAANNDLDQEWRFHLLVVPGRMGCGRGEMFDSTGNGTLAPRQGAVSYCDDGYPTTDSANFGTAANQEQRNVHRAFLRSASHEVGHGFNQEHQNLTGIGEPGADNSIMTPTPSVADYLASSSTGTFPQDINLGFNNHVRHHLIHFPDPVVRPGGMNFEDGHQTTVPSADTSRVRVGADNLRLDVHPDTSRLKLGQPLKLHWDLTNITDQPIPAPNDLSREARHVRVHIVGPDDTIRPVPSIAVRTDNVAVRPLASGESASGSGTVFWGSRGFAFQRPGKHELVLDIVWNYDGIGYQCGTSVPIWVDHPITDDDNAVAELLLHHEVGLIVALGGAEEHLPDGAARLAQAGKDFSRHPAVLTIAEVTGPTNRRDKRSATKPASQPSQTKSDRMS